ncbi:hypothetical protein P12x_003026 [Tundrisphaera lichenicola]|uniref:hypothetical protein n=1 Tax=Tundrisphaera lichenicola TaxID=2029860 RepID=UPI003EBF74E5
MSKRRRNARKKRAHGKRNALRPIELGLAIVEPPVPSYHPPKKGKFHYARRKRNRDRERNEEHAA